MAVMIMAVPGSPLNPRSDGCNQLIRDGACRRCNRMCQPPTTKLKYHLQRLNGPMACARALINSGRQCRATLLRDLSFDPVDIDDLMGRCAQPTGCLGGHFGAENHWAGRLGITAIASPASCRNSKSPHQKLPEVLTKSFLALSHAVHSCIGHPMKVVVVVARKS